MVRFAWIVLHNSLNTGQLQFEYFILNANGFEVRIFNKLCPAGTDTGLNAVGSVRKKGNKSEKY